MSLGSDSNAPPRGKGVLDMIAIMGIVLITVGLNTHWAPAWLTPLRIAFGLISVLFAPGYVTFVALLPTLARVNRLTRWGDDEYGLNRWEQLLVSVMLSIVIVPILGLGISITPVGVRPVMMVLAISGYTIVIACIAAIRRLFVTDTPTRLSSTPSSSWTDRLHGPATRTDLLLNLLIIVVLLVAGVMIVAPPVGQDEPQFTEFSVLSEDESGNLTMGDYLQTNESEPVISDGSESVASVTLDVTNQEQQPVEYTVIVHVQRAEVEERSVAVLDQQQTSTINVSLEDGERARIPYEITTPEAETGCRITFLLYEGSPPSSPTMDNSYRELHIWDAADPPPEQGSCPNPSVISADTDESAITVSDAP